MKIGDAASDPLTRQLQRALDVMSRRQQLIASNVGNLDTPDYRTVDLDFDKALQQATALPDRTSSVPGLAPADTGSLARQAREVDGLATRPDGNNVSLDREMMALAATRHRYDTATALIRSRFKLLRTAISEGRG